MLCRYCNHPVDFKFLDYGKMPLVNRFISSRDEFKKEKKYPLDLNYCDNCGLVQIGTVVDPEILFKDYIYFSSTSESFRQHGKQLAESFKKRFNLDPSSLVVEIASNDGCVLNSFKELGIGHLGVEPASNIAKIANEKGIRTENEFFSLETAKKLLEKYGPADVIFGMNVFAHIPEIHDFVMGLKTLLKQQGVVAIESPYLTDFIKNVEFDTVYHEHVAYLSLRTMKALFARFDMEVIDAEWQDIHGGSMRYFIANKSEHPVSENVAKFLALEEESGLKNRETYITFAGNVARLRSGLISLLDKLKKDGKAIACYGASAKGVVLLNYCGIDGKYIDFIADKSKYKQGMFLPGVHLEVCDPKKLVDDMPDYVLLLAWNFADEILKQQEEYRKKGGKFIIPVPDVRVL